MRGGNWHMRRWWWKTPAWNSSANRKEGLREKFHRTLGQSLREVGVGLSDLENYRNCSTQSPDFDTTHSLQPKPRLSLTTKQNLSLKLTGSLKLLLFFFFFFLYKENNENNQPSKLTHHFSPMWQGRRDKKRDCKMLSKSSRTSSI